MRETYSSDIQGFVLEINKSLYNLRNIWSVVGDSSEKSKSFRITKVAFLLARIIKLIQSGLT